MSAERSPEKTKDMQDEVRFRRWRKELRFVDSGGLSLNTNDLLEIGDFLKKRKHLNDEIKTKAIKYIDDCEKLLEKYNDPKTSKVELGIVHKALAKEIVKYKLMLPFVTREFLAKMRADERHSDNYRGGFTFSEKHINMHFKPAPANAESDQVFRWQAPEPTKPSLESVVGPEQLTPVVVPTHRWIRRLRLDIQPAKEIKNIVVSKVQPAPHVLFLGVLKGDYKRDTYLNCSKSPEIDRSDESCSYSSSRPAYTEASASTDHGTNISMEEDDGVIFFPVTQEGYQAPASNASPRKRDDSEDCSQRPNKASRSL